MPWYNPLTWGSGTITEEVAPEIIEEAIPETKPDSIRMVVRKENIRAYPDKVLVHLDFYTQPDCMGYSKYVHDVLGDDGKPTGEKVLHTFLGKDFGYDEKWAPEAIKKDIQEKFAHTKRNYAKKIALSNIIDMEYKE